MSSISKEQAQKFENNSDTQTKDIVISIILSESTASILEINAPNLQDLIIEESSTSLFSLRNLKFFKNEISPKPSGLSLRQLFSGNKYKELDGICTEEVYFAKNFDSSSVESFVGTNDDMEEDYIVLVDECCEQSPLLMERYEVYTRPLLSAKTTAHDNKIKCESNNIYVSILESELTITSSGWVNFCRICHGGESVANLITPCRCRGSIALAHLECLEEWLKQSANSRCELCQHRFEIIRKPKYGIIWSILVFLTRPGDRFKELLFDILGFLIYTPTAIASTYLLMVLCDNIAMRHNLQYSRNITNHFLAFTAVFGMAMIDFTYSSWLVLMFQRHLDAWKEWYQNNCTLRVVLPPRKLQRHNRKIKKNQTSLSIQLD